MKKFAKLIALCLVMSLISFSLFSLSAQAQENTNSKKIVSTGAVGTGVGEATTLVDFSTTSLYDFGALGNTSEPTFRTSATWNSNVLYVWINSAEAETGIRGTLPNASGMKGASTLSVKMLAQYTKTTTYKATLRLEGVDKNGAPLSLESTASASSANWQTVTFDIAAFAESANLDAPCTITVLTSSDKDAEEFVLWVHSIYANALSSQPEFLMPTVIAGGSFLIGFLFFFVIYRTTCKKNRRPRW